MTNIDERSRRALYERLEDTIGAEGADTLMSMLPRVGWADVATTRDLDSLRIATTHDLDRLGAELHRDMALLGSDLRGEMSQLRDELRGDMSSLRDELRGEMTELRDDLRGEMHQLRDELRTEATAIRIELHDGLRDTTRTLFLGMLTCMLTMTGLFLTALTLTR